MLENIHERNEFRFEISKVPALELHCVVIWHAWIVFVRSIWEYRSVFDILFLHIFWRNISFSFRTMREENYITSVHICFSSHQYFTTLSTRLAAKMALLALSYNCDYAPHNLCAKLDFYIEMKIRYS